MKLIVLFVLISIATAQSCTNCAFQCGPNGRCLVCDNGFFLDNVGSCGRYTPIEDCKTYDTQTGGCAQCFPGSILQFGICQQMIPNCNFTLTNNTEICSQCNNSFVLVNDIKCYSTNTANCPLGSLPRVLQTTGQAFCQHFELQSCSIPSNDISHCRVCFNDYFNLNGVCNNLTSQVPCNNNACQCQFYYRDNVCYQFNIEGCLSSKDRLYCDLCNDTLVAVSGRCFEPVKIADIHCNVLEINSDICTGCNFQYLLDPNNICVKAFSLCNDPKKSCESQCNHPSLLLYNGECYIKDSLCIAYDTVNYKCTNCFEGYFLNSNNRCEQREKCWVYATGGRNCQRCFTGFQLNPANLACDKLPHNCRQMNSAGVCQTCSSFTELFSQQIPSTESYPSNLSIAVNTSVCIYSTANCQYYNIFGYCEICRTNYVQRKRVCVPIATNCQVPSQSDMSKCQVCGLGYELDPSSLTCYPRIEGCQQYAVSKVCIRCNDGYVLRNGLCFYRDVNCLEYDSKGFCLRCGNSLVPYYNQCVFYDPYCFLYDRNGFCSTTLGGFSKSDAFGTNLQTNYRSFIAYTRNIQQQASSSSSGGSASSGGASSSGSSFSQLSIFGGFFTSQGWIRVLPTIGLYNERISQYDLNGRIRSCRDGFTLLNGNCVMRIDYCLEYSSSNGQCVRCSPFYHMGAGRKCISTSSSICLIATSTGEFCSKCSSEYTLINGQCYFSRLNVIEYSSSNSSKITSVQNGYFVWQKNQIAYPYDSNCVNQQQPGKCLQCIQESEFTQSGMRNIDGRCVLVKENCARYSARGLCEVCSTGNLLYYGQCYPNNCLVTSTLNDACVTCPFLFNYEAGLCVNKVQSNCLVYDQVTNFNPTTIRSIGCRFCVAGFYLKSDNTCERMINNCQMTDSQNGRCTQCITGFVIYEEQCVKEIVGCQIYNRATSYTTCTQCITNYNLTNNMCYTLPPRCIELNSSGMCSKCQTGYNPIVQGTESICIFTVSNCITYNRQGRCTLCTRNFVLQKNVCNFFVQGCQDLSNDTCIRCLPGFYLRNGFCITDPNCITVENALCTKCIDGFRLVNGLCVKNSIDNCLTQRDEDCLECLSGYMKITLYGKVYCILRRIIISGCSSEQYPCQKCDTGFELRDDGLCYAKRCLYQLSRFSLRTCSACYPYYRLDPTNRFCILYNCRDPSCYDTTVVPEGFRQANRTGFLIEIQYCTQLEEDYSCRACTNYRYPNVLVQWNLCHPSNCKSPQLYNCSGNCYNYFNNWLADKSVCVADNCQTYNNDGTCSVCVKPYNVVNGICLYEGPCLDYNPVTSQCRSCRDQFTLVSGSCIPKNCTSYSPTDVSTCLDCQRGFELTPNKTCQLKYCTFPNQNYPCVQCITGYFFNQFTNLCHMINCLSFDYLNNRCQQCEPQYKLANQYCVPDQCANFSTATWKCAGCSAGYRLNSNGLCVIDNCCSFNGIVCTQCCSGYDYIQGLCRPRCTQNNSQGVCVACRTGFKLNSNNQCVTEIAGCITYVSSQCTQCQVGLMPLRGRCIPKYCLSYTEANPTFCTRCHPRFYALNTGLCYPKNCAQFNTTDWTCSQCESAATFRFSLIQNQSLCLTDKCSSYQLSDFVCRSCESLSPTSQYRLQTINDSEVCVLQCGLYYELSNSECKLKYCSNFYSNGKCQSCAPGFQLEVSTGLCKLKYCLNYNQQNCVQCQNGFVIDSFNKRYCVPVNCQNYNFGSDICQKCQDGFVREYNLCVLRDCLLYNGQYVCQKCMQGFNLTQFNGQLICQKNFNSSCADGYFFSSSRGSCQPIPVEFCRYVNPSNPSACLSCFPNYFLNQGVCYSIDGCQDLMFSYIYGCKDCIRGFKLQGNLCVKDLCDQYEPNNVTCRTCVNGFFLFNGNCVSYDNFCISGNVFQGCVTCQTGYQTVSGICRKLPDFCSLIDPTLSCIQCASNYILSNGICYRIIPNCAIQRANFCERCDNLYATSADQRSCISKQPIKYCQQHDSTFDFCLLCQDGYKITSDKKCLAEFCSKYDLQTYICTECENRTTNGVSLFYALRNEKCISISINFCSIPLNEVACRVCFDGFLLENGVCKAQNCQVYRQNNQQCSTCLSGFYLVQNNICRKYPDNCDVVNTLGNCTVCSSGFALNSNGMCVRGTQFCVQYNGDGICVTCQTGYYLNSGRLCVKLPDNCVNANTFGQCLQCVDPFAVSSSGICYRLVQNCSRYNDLGACVACTNGFYLTVNSACQILPANCLFATSTGICRQCIAGFRLENGTCIRIIENCATYQGNTCSSCIPNFFLINGLCYRLPSNCAVVSQQSQCLRCESSYTLFRGSCYQTIQSCLTYSPIGQCTECSPGLYVNAAGRCSQIPNNCNRVNVNGICLECASGFALSNGVCFREVNNCFAYNPSNNLCRQCSSGFSLIDGKCFRLPENCLVVNTQEICLNCVSGYTLQNGICYLTLPFCDFYVSSGICNRCINGYYLTATGTCTNLPEGCSQMSSNSNQGCASCVVGFVLQGGICYKQFPGCFIYDQVSRQCRQCNQNFSLVNGFCYQLPANCLSVNSQRQCMQCAQGFILQSGICYRQIENCVAYSGTTCIQCVNGYYVNAGACAIMPANCIDMSQSGSCLRCAENFFLQNGICYRFDKNCVSYDQSTFVCRTCADGFYLNFQFVCQIVPLNCLNVNVFGNCTSCRNNFTLRNGLCYPSIPQCDNWNLATMLCAKCISGFFLRDGFCYRTVQNCAIYSPTNFVCIKCIDNYILANNICMTCAEGLYIDSLGQCRQNPLNCRLANQFGQCLQCLAGFTIINNQCNQQVAFCQNYSQSAQGRTTCAQCFIGYYLRDQFTCLRLPNGCAQANSAGFCMQCNEGYAVNTNGVCYLMIAFCQTYQLSTGQCVECIQNYYININQTCVPMLESNCLFANSLGQCIQCVQSYILVSSICYPAIPFCFNHSTSSYVCLQCFQGYYLFNRSCNRIPVGCLNMVNNMCASCMQGYNLNNGLCILVDNATCIKYQLISNVCIECKAGFYLANNNICMRVPEYCTQANNQGQCLGCVTGYTLSNGICYKEVPNCLRWGQGNCLLCADQFYLQNNLCYRFPDFCQTFDNITLSCLRCVSGYQLSFGRCIINLQTNCHYFNPLQSAQCYTCKNSFYENWVNPTTNEVVTTLMPVERFCLPYPEFCTSIDLLGNCISCCFGSQLNNGRCVGTTQRSLNCDVFDSVNLRCIRCMTGYVYCDWLAICIEVNLNCLASNSLQQCTRCVEGFNLVNGDCIKPAPGMSSSNSASCISGYTYSTVNEYGSQAGSCFRNKNELRRISTIAQYFYTTNRPGQNATAQRFSNLIYNPPSFLNNYFAFVASKPQIIHYIQLQGSQSGYVTHYQIQYRNKDNAPFICWNSCQKVRGNMNGNEVAQLKLTHPIVATEIRIYPLRWVGSIWMSIEMLVEGQ